MRHNGFAFALAFASVLGALFVAACSAAGRVEVVTTTVQVAALAREVTKGTPVQVLSLVGPGVDPHEYEVSPGDVQQVGAAKLVLRSGIGLDAFLDRALTSSGQKRVATVTEGIKLRQIRTEQGKTEDDPHVWHDPANDRVMVENIVKALGATFPEQAATFQKNGSTYAAKLDATDAQIRQIIGAIPAANRKMVTDHDAFGYFLDRYGLPFVGAVIPNVSTQGDTSAKQIAELQDTVKREGVKAIFSEESVDPRIAREIAKDTNVQIVADLYGDSLGKPGSGQETVDGMLLYNARRIAEALK